MSYQFPGSSPFGRRLPAHPPPYFDPPESPFRRNIITPQPQPNQPNNQSTPRNDGSEKKQNEQQKGNQCQGEQGRS
ncbi:hypothetical protein OESDEN_22269 [Oesophagostomum dentatum]|uniref:Uncharacterized protein n=1 Tax=Oesophagostomum dentatum TaxID=61180 RepID=A0A0B1S2K8_OESDE|nr:hypothetical protein OESDEN_22269 [Oesophagostomum dentatum]